MEKLVFYIQGGIGKVIMSTAVIRNFKEKHPETKVIAISGYPEVFLHNPYVHRALTFDTPYLWKDHFNTEKGWVVAADPYFTEDWIKNRPVHLIETWTKMLDPTLKVIHKYPDLYFSSAEVDDMKAMINVDKTLLVVQSTGGADPGKSDWTRNPPKEELEAYLGKYMEDYFILHLALPTTPVLTNIHQRIEQLSRRQSMCLIHYCPKFIGIDSFGVHCRAAQKVQSDTDIFLPVPYSKERLSYDIVNNILPTEEVRDLIQNDSLFHSTIFRNNIQASPESCPVPPGIVWFK
jgi:hypothetical protein